jgi:hypothetical protein
MLIETLRAFWRNSTPYFNIPSLVQWLEQSTDNRQTQVRFLQEGPSSCVVTYFAEITHVMFSSLLNFQDRS